LLGFFALTLFVSALLLFLVQPMVAKIVLPNLGGTPAVWNTCMVFFQAALLAGYAYAHATTKWLGVRRQALLHCAVLLLPLVVLPIALTPGWLPPGDANPVPWLLLFLVTTVGLPFFVVSTSAPLLQKWFASTGHPAAKDPYFLYAASNLGSMLALLGYPTLVEPNLRLATQSKDWSLGYGLLILLTVACAYLVWKTAPTAASQRGAAPGTTPAADEADRPTATRRLRWVALAFVPSSLMLGVTTYITTDIAAIAYLWVLPLSLYLLSFIIVFAKMPAVLDKLVLIGLFAAGTIYASTLLPADSAPEFLTKALGERAPAFVLWAVRLGFIPFLLLLYPGVPPLLHRTMLVLVPAMVLGMVYMSVSGQKPGMVTLILLHLALLFIVAMACHGELARDRPSTAYLTEFYLWMSVGGVLGGIFNALVAPMVFYQLTEYPLVMTVACMLIAPLGSESRGSRATFWVDVVLAVIPAALGCWLLYQSEVKPDAPLTWDRIKELGGRFKEIVDLGNVHSLALLGVAILALLVYVAYRKQDWSVRLLDIVAALALGLLSVGLILGLPGSKLDLSRVAEILGMTESGLRRLVTYVLPLVLCVTLLGRPVRFGLGVAALLLAGFFCDSLDSNAIYRDRSFFGTLAVKEYKYSGGSHELVHGTTLHGKQFLDPDRRREALTYYHRTGPIGQVFTDIIEPEHKKNIALIGLGTGTLSSYAEPGQHFTFYEIDRAVRRIAQNPDLFSYYTDAEQRGADVKVVMGDARLRLKQADDGQYDLIIVDAFTSDAIPIHLLTKDALEMYEKKLAPGGIVAFHTSNRYLDLDPEVGNMAKALGLVAILREDRGEEAEGKTSSTWVLVARKEEDFGALAKDIQKEPGGEGKWKRELGDDAPVWTDDYSNLLRRFNWKAR
jgi:hypothetical protein